MSWLALELEIDSAAAEPLSEALLELGADSVTIEEAGSSLAAQPDDEAGVPRWQLNRVRAIVSPDTEPAGLLRSAAEAAGLSATPRFEVHRVEAEDWVRRTQAQFGPLRVGERLWIVPSWATPPSSGEPVLVRLDPGLAFGTGSHPTTRLVLGWLERQFARGGIAHSVLDYGCGSGILAIAAAKLGAGQIVATDNDAQALRTCTENARTNGVSIGVLAPEQLPARQFDLIVANILARPLIELAPALAAFARQGTGLALSGILQEQADEIARTYAAWFDLAVAGSDEGWVLLAGARR